MLDTVPELWFIEIRSGLHLPPATSLILLSHSILKMRSALNAAASDIASIAISHRGAGVKDRVHITF